MSGNHNGDPSWDPRSSSMWAEILGLTPVPLFGTGIYRQSGDNVLLQDGEKSTFVFLSSNDARFELDEQPLSWSWSAFTRHVLVLDQRVDRLYLRRWDRPTDIRQFKVPIAGIAAEEILGLMDKSPSPRSPDVINYVLQGFRLLRQATSDSESIVALKLLNAFLLVTESVQRSEIQRDALLNCRTFSQLLSLLSPDQNALVDLDQSNISRLGTSVGTIPYHFLEREPLSGCQLEAHLLFRHAASQLYQEAHLQIEREEQRFLPGLAPTNAPRGKLSKDVRYTPANLARSLVQEALKAIDLSTGSQVLTVLDPACGSGIFLQECLRELDRTQYVGHLSLEGYDVSQAATYMARFCLGHAKLEARSFRCDVKIEALNALREDWNTADIILMNPPFLPWNDLDEEQQEMVQQSLGGAAFGHTDMAMAFLHKAVASVREGGVVAAVLPAPLLSNESGKLVRDELSSQTEIVFVGRFEGYRYFANSLVEPAFIILRRRNIPDSDVGMVKVLVANEDQADVALRLRRRMDKGIIQSQKQVEIFELPSSAFDSKSWLPSRQRAYQIRNLLTKLNLPKVGDLFSVRQGARTGHNPAFVLQRGLFERLPEAEREYFRPVAGQGTLRDGVLEKNFFVFYPYDSEGPLITDESQLKNKLPVYFQHLTKWTAQLKKRAKIRHWWLLTWPRVWQYEPQCKLVSTYFGTSGSFAYDADGEFVVVQGDVWLWKSQMAPSKSVDLQATMHGTPLPWAYLAILNSGIFEKILAIYCPRVQGGQFNLSHRFVRDVPIPNLAQVDTLEAEILSQLQLLGERIQTGSWNRRQRGEFDAIVCRAYGLPDSLLEVSGEDL